MKVAVQISGAPSAGPDLQELLELVARGDQDAFARVYDAVCGPGGSAQPTSAPLALLTFPTA